VPLRDLDVSARRTIPARWLSFRASRSGGPGGQHVNKVATRVAVSLDLAGATARWGNETRTRVRRKLVARLDARGLLTVTCGSTRSRERNLELAQRRLEELLRGALERPRERRPTQASRAGRQRRMDEKRRRGARKALRKSPDRDT
jgi:ribosome-associated protein